MLVSRAIGSSTSSSRGSAVISSGFESLLIQSSNSNQLSANLLHLEFMHHFSIKTFNYEGVNSISFDVQSHVMAKYGFSSSVLMHEILALAALNLSIVRSARQKFYHHQAQELQIYALSLYNCEKIDITLENCAPMFLFFVLLGTHTLCDIIVFRDDDFNAFLDGFVNYLHLNCGLRAVTGRCWHQLLETDLKSLLENSGFPDHESTGSECNKLLALIEIADISQFAFNTFQHAIHNLQRVFDAQRSATGSQTGINTVMAWPVLLSAEFSELVMQRRPEALVILAYYGVLLHQSS